MDKYLERGNMMWEGSRMLLHEHREALEKYHRDKLKEPPPDPCREDLMEMGKAAMDSLNYEIEVTVTLWEDGFFKEETGVVERVEELQQRMKFKGKWISFKHLKWIERKNWEF